MTVHEPECRPHADAIADASADERRAWARGVLGLPAAANAADERLAICRLLQDQDFLPRRSLEDAIHVVTMSDDDVDLASMQEESRGRLRQEIEDFALHFFEHSPAARQALWESYFARAADHPEQAARLTLLQPGLAVEDLPGVGASSATEMLVGAIQECFPLPPLAQIARRRELLEQFAEGLPLFARTELSYDFRHWAALDEAFVERIDELALPDATADVAVLPAAHQVLAKRRRLNRVENVGRSIGQAALVAACLIVATSYVNHLITQIAYPPPPPRVRSAGPSDPSALGKGPEPWLLRQIKEPPQIKVRSQIKERPHGE